VEQEEQELIQHQLLEQHHNLIIQLKVQDLLMLFLLEEVEVHQPQEQVEQVEQGGGGGVNGPPGVQGGSGDTNSGSGGGGHFGDASAGGAGGSGMVIVKEPAVSIPATIVAPGVWSLNNVYDYRKSGDWLGD
jgi:hypothetical protein